MLQINLELKSSYLSNLEFLMLTQMFYRNNLMTQKIRVKDEFIKFNLNNLFKGGESNESPC